MRQIVAFIAVVFILRLDVSAELRKVPQQYVNIQAAINSANQRDTVIVSIGTYFENINFLGKGITVASNYIFSGLQSDIENTIINGSRPVSPDSASCVRIYRNTASLEDTSAALIGFTLTGGRGTIWEDEHSLGSYYREGGAILIQYMAPRILNNIIYANEAYDKTGLTSAGGGAIRCGDGNPLIAGNLIFKNKARYGGGIVLNFSGGRIYNNILTGNYGGEDFGGGGIWIYGASPKPVLVINNTLIRNSSKTRGGGIWVSNSALTANSNIIWGNSATNNPQVYSTGSTVGIKFSNVQSGFSGSGNINIEPLFLDSSFVLSPNSPCIDGGDTAASYNDIPVSSGSQTAATPSQGSIRNDMGAFGGPLVLKVSRVISSIKKTQMKLTEFNEFQLDSNFPNPFNPSTIIQYELLTAGLVKLSVMKENGETVAVLEKIFKPAGRYQIAFNAAGLPTGVYFYSVEFNGKRKINKMLLLK